MKTKQQLLIVGILVAVLVCADQITKIWAVAALSSQPRALLGNFLSFELVYNSGAAFSLGSSTTWIFTLIAAAACIALPILIIRCRRFSSRLILGVIWAGALGNFIDRLFRDPGFGQGHVVDFINYSDFFVGNVADIELVVGAAALIILEFLLSRSEGDESCLEGDDSSALAGREDPAQRGGGEIPGAESVSAEAESAGCAGAAPTAPCEISASMRSEA